MKRFLLLALALGAGAVFGQARTAAQGFYFDIGFGAGKAFTELDGVDVADALGSSVTDVGVEIGLKAGYGPIARIPLYVVGEFGGIGHRFWDSYNYLQFNSYLIGPGVVFYPIPLLQLGASVGFSFAANQSDLPMTMYDSKGEFAWDVSCAVDLGRGNNGCLLGVKFISASNTLEVSGAEENSSLISVFAKYTYRRKAKVTAR